MQGLKGAGWRLRCIYMQMNNLPDARRICIALYRMRLTHPLNHITLKDNKTVMVHHGSETMQKSNCCM